MRAEDYARVRQLFDEAIDVDPDHRDAFLDERCADDPELRENVARLLDQDTKSFAVPLPDTRLIPPGDDHPSSIGPYRILGILGEGGMGRVYMAEQREPVQRRVAIKVIKFGMDTKAVLARFEAERSALALMNHPNIAKALDVGATPEGRPYFAMELVQGIPITEYCNRARLPIALRLALVQQVCFGLQHAHQKGVAHRDIKPSNVLVQVLDGKPVPKIIDFGVAKATNQRLTEQTLYTEQGQLIGTPEYMSPEQADLTNVDVDTRTDIYSLGVVLYELLSGSLPFEPKELRRAGFVEMQRRICEDEPLRPSARLTRNDQKSETVARSIGSAPRTLSRTLKGDLDWITMRCLEKSPQRRYQSASELAADLQRHLDHEPVEASSPSASYKLRKFLRRRRGPVAAGVALVLALAIGAVVSLWQASRARQAAADARTSERAERKARLEEKRQRVRAQAAETQERATAVRLRQRTREFERVKGVVLLDRARRRAAALAPAWPGQLPAIETWITTEAKELIELKSELVATVAELRKRAEPWTPEDQQRDRRSHPARQRLERNRQHLRILERAMRVQAGQKAVERPTLPKELAAAKVGVLHQIAFMRVTFPHRAERTIYGEEAFGLAAAELALQKALAGDRSVSLYAVYQVVLLALYENGLDADATELAKQALTALPGSIRDRARTTFSRIADAVGAKARPARLAALRKAIHELERAVSAQRTWSFESDSEQFLHDTLVDLIEDVERFEKKDLAVVRRRKSWAEGLAALERDPDYLLRWRRARADIELGETGQKLPIQHGLVPIGKNPKTGLWEFYHLRSAWTEVSGQSPREIAVPRIEDYDTHGGYGPTDELPGIVFVLLPGGTFTIGAQDSNRRGFRYDPDGSRTEGWPQPVTLSPFFLAKHEVTKGQWARLADGDRPSRHRAGTAIQGTSHSIGWQNPVEMISWPTANDLTKRFGLLLPTEAQWEYACRAGTDTPYSTGKVAGTLRGFANVYDRIAARLTGGESDVRFEDGYRIAAPAGTFRPNAWGFHDMHGNVWEWCRDGGMHRPYPGLFRSGDGLTPEPGERLRITRGGGYDDTASEARSARRSPQPIATQEPDIGVRFSRPVYGLR